MYSQNVFVITDGEIENTDEVIELTEKHKHMCEVHTIGIGNEVDHYLVEGLAVTTGGIFSFVDNGDGMINTKVIDALSRAIEPSYT